MRSTLASISSLLVSFGLLCLGHGLQNTLIGIRASLESYPDFIIGLMMSAYFSGFIFGTRLAAAYIVTVGQIRTFAALASLISAVSLLHVLIVDPYVWIGLRFIYGICIAGTYTVIESWLNALANAHNRGRIMSIYMIVNFLGLSLSQMFFELSDGTTYVLFAVVSILISLSLVPLILSKAKQPEELNTETLTLKRLYIISPLACTGAIIVGITSGAFWGLIAPFLTKMQFLAEDTAQFIAITFIGALVFQWPIGLLSDKVGRRVTILISSFAAAILCQLVLFQLQADNTISYALIAISLLFGGMSFPLYSLFISLANDFMKSGQFVKASAGLLVLHSIGAIAGPVCGALAMQFFGPEGLFQFLSVMFFSLCGFACYRTVQGRALPADTDPFVALPRTTGAVYTMDPRYKEEQSSSKQ